METALGVIGIALVSMAALIMVSGAAFGVACIFYSMCFEEKRN